MPPAGGRPRWLKRGRSARRLAAACIVVVSLCVVVGGGGAGVVSPDFRRMPGTAGPHPGDHQLVIEEAEPARRGYGGGGRRLLSGGPGSHPPRCTAKCGSCSPCYPVHVSVPPGVLVTTEYYPEAWRCKCRNQLYMP
ncbi:hypothetical protein ACP4OV_028787 [Aristida adscensionis]